MWCYCSLLDLAVTHKDFGLCFFSFHECKEGIVLKTLFLFCNDVADGCDDHL